MTQNGVLRWCNKTNSHEQTPGKGDTTGFPLRQHLIIEMDARGFKALKMKRNNHSVVQTSLFLLQGWRANVDIQFLICDQGIDKVTASDIARVTEFIVSQICKGTESMIKEKFHFKSTILREDSSSGSKNDLRRVTRKLLNETV